MEENKYYTPDISELCVGFEFERRYSEVGEWKKETIEEYMLVTPNIGEPCDSEITEIIQDIKNGLVRVAYLSKEDIESLGWINLSQVATTEGVITIIGAESKDEKYKLIYSVYNKSITLYKDEDDDGFCFKIKNRSELKKLMQQLDIKIN